MNKLVITHDENVSIQDALSYAKRVIANGRISKNTKHGEQYCFLTVFESGVNVSADKSKTQDTLHISKP